MGLVTHLMFHQMEYWQADQEGVTFLETTTGDLLDARTREQPEQKALVFGPPWEQDDGQHTCWTYQRLYEQAIKLLDQINSGREIPCNSQESVFLFLMSTRLLSLGGLLQ
jgi:hypothetical protein